MEWVSSDVSEISWWGNVVSKTTNWSRVSCHVILLPLSKKRNDKVTLELFVKHLGEEIQVGDESSLENNWNVRGVEELDWVWLSVTSHLSRTDLKLYSEALYSTNRLVSY